MQAQRSATIVLLAALAMAPTSVLAGVPQAPSARDLAAVVHEHAAKRDADRQTVRNALTRPEVRDVAERFGFDLDRIAASIDTMSPAELDHAAGTARQMTQQLDHQLAGGRDTITLSTNTIIIILLVLLLLVVVAR